MPVNFEMMHARKPNAPAVVLLSGGLDSATVLAIAKKLGYAVYALSFRYGQRHSSELDAATRVAKSLGAVEHQIIDLDLRRFVGGSALTDDAYDVPTSPGANNEIPITYVKIGHFFNNKSLFKIEVNGLVILSVYLKSNGLNEWKLFQ